MPVFLAASGGQPSPLTWLPAIVGLLSILVVAAKVGRIIGSTEEHLEAQDATLEKQNDTLARQDKALARLEGKVDALQTRDLGEAPDDAR